MAADSPNSIGLVLEGGGLRGLFTAGVLDFWMENDLTFSYGVGVSAGACNLMSYVAHQIGYAKDCMVRLDSSESYYGLSQLHKSKKLLDLDKVFFEYPYHQVPFDFDAFFRSPINYEMAVTNCADGKAEYLSEHSDPQRLSLIVKASSSMPLITEMVHLDGKEYLDGGITDSIPLRRAIETGHCKNVVILTRQQGHTVHDSKSKKAMYDAVYSKHPALLAALQTRPELYLEQLDLVREEEAAGRAFVIRPTQPEVGHLETNYNVLMDFYLHGYATAQSCYQDLLAFLRDA